MSDLRPTLQGATEAERFAELTRRRGLSGRISTAEGQKAYRLKDFSWIALPIIVHGLASLATVGWANTSMLVFFLWQQGWILAGLWWLGTIVAMVVFFARGQRTRANWMLVWIGIGFLVYGAGIALTAVYL